MVEAALPCLHGAQLVTHVLQQRPKRQTCPGIARNDAIAMVLLVVLVAIGANVVRALERQCQNSGPPIEMVP